MIFSSSPILFTRVLKATSPCSESGLQYILKAFMFTQVYTYLCLQNV
jgi:hypothetical protein